MAVILSKGRRVKALGTSHMATNAGKKVLVSFFHSWLTSIIPCTINCDKCTQWINVGNHLLQLQWWRTQPSYGAYHHEYCNTYSIYFHYIFNPKKISFHTTDLMMAIRNCMFNYILWRLDISFIFMRSGSAGNIKEVQTWYISRQKVEGRNHILDGVIC